MSSKANPLTEKQKIALNELVKEVSAEQIIWLNGFLEGRLAGMNGGTIHAEKAAVEVAANAAVANLTILYGTETGNARELANKLKEKASFKNISVNLLSLYDYDPRKLKDEENVAILVSTHGEGEPPDMAEDFHKFVTGKRLPNLEKVRFSVLALGDKTYRNFCQTGEDIFKAIKKSGAFPVTPLAKCDLNYEVTAEVWMNNLLLNLAPAKTAKSAEITEVITSGINNNGQPEAEFSKKNPFPAVVLDKVRITGRDSDKEVYHLELSLEGSGLTYEPGDSLGIFTKNPSGLVDQIIKKTGVSPDKMVLFSEEDEEQVTLINALTHRFEITVVTFDLLQKYYEQTKNEDLKKLLDDDKNLDEYLYGSDLLDLLEDFPFDWNINKLLEILRPLPPRLYSISSSMERVGEEVHITVSVVNFEKKNRKRTGACTSNLAGEIDIEDEILVYIEKNPGFRLPANGAKMIMVGAGTGIAPYRAFMQHRESLGMIGDTWLFFGDRRFCSDFLYQAEWLKMREKKFLERMEVAFSRDQQEKIYVQHKLIENQKEIFEWIENGAVVYLCGDRRNLAKDVNKTLLEIIRTQGGISEEQAEKYLKNLKREKRFQVDVY